ncbi:MAG: hypothetical protein HYU80_02345 [Candidatus Blackburnbacteria bacterium]|nr:hypothetical protein [Candidatus Blackburnbacteria bacterium]
MKKALPVIVVVLIGLLVGGGAVFGWKRLSQPPKEEGEVSAPEQVLKELSLSERPYTSLTPGSSCEYTLVLQRIQGNPDKIEYEIVYKDEKGVTQGASGTITPKGKTNAEKKVLFGTESSGHRRCDKGVEGGNIVLRYRNPEGKLTAKMETEFGVYENTRFIKLSSNFDLALPSSVTLITTKYLSMGTIGLPGLSDEAPGRVVAGPYAVFPDGSLKRDATVDISGSGKLYGWDGSKWVELSDGKSSFLGTYILVASE